MEKYASVRLEKTKIVRYVDKMPRYKATVEYDGSNFHGWQRQDSVPSVQQSIEHAIKLFCNEEVEIHTAGRTDAGVHAIAQVFHFDLLQIHDPFKIMSAVNHHMKPAPISLLAVETIDDEFHARFSAKKRYYLYRIINRRAPLALEYNRAWQVPVALDAQLMQQAASYLIGFHDFTSFRDTECQSKSPLKTLDEIRIERIGEEIKIYVSAKSFLHHMVRNITGTLKMVGEGKWPPEYMLEILAAKNRSSAGPTAPACGLYLTKVDY